MLRAGQITPRRMNARWISQAAIPAQPLSLWLPRGGGSEDGHKLQKTGRALRLRWEPAGIWNRKRAPGSVSTCAPAPSPTFLATPLSALPSSPSALDLRLGWIKQRGGDGGGDGGGSSRCWPETGENESPSTGTRNHEDAHELRKCACWENWGQMQRNVPQKPLHKPTGPVAFHSVPHDMKEQGDPLGHGPAHPPFLPGGFHDASGEGGGQEEGIMFPDSLSYIFPCVFSQGGYFAKNKQIDDQALILAHKNRGRRSLLILMSHGGIA